MVYYKYAGDSGFKILENLRLKVTPPNEFNDPFEITPNTKRARPLAEMLANVRPDSKYFRDVYEDMLRDGACTGSFDQFIRDMPSAISKHYSSYKKLSKQEMIKRDMAALNDVSSQLGVLCLSKPSNNIPMWSYYANHHRGVAFGINIDDIGGRLDRPSGFVKYRKHRVRLNPFAVDQLAASQRERVLFTKSSEWQHEQEYRLVFPLSDLISPSSTKRGAKTYFLDISGDSIQEIIFGCRVKPRLEKKIRQELERRRKTFGHIRLFRCTKHATEFELKIIPIT
jgi:hypothetical protein